MDKKYAEYFEALSNLFCEFYLNSDAPHMSPTAYITANVRCAEMGHEWSPIEHKCAVCGVDAKEIISKTFMPIQVKPLDPAHAALLESAEKAFEGYEGGVFSKPVCTCPTLLNGHHAGCPEYKSSSPKRSAGQSAR